MNETPSATSDYPLPPQPHTDSGAVRRVGLEFEMAHAGIEVLADAVRQRFGGEIAAHTPYEHEVTGAEFGTWKLELDWSFLQAWARSERATASPFDDLEEVLEDLLRRGSEHFVPYEVVSPPIPMTELGAIDRLVAELRARGARGTSYGLNYAFGMQLNVELPDTGAGTIVDYLKAFACLHDWLKKRAKVDITRRLTAFFGPYPTAYVRRLVEPDYRPGRDELIADYLYDNPTRNRALDLLPLFKHLDADTVLAAVPDHRVKPRPALHYRLPDCRIDLPEWGLRPTWDDWLAVEHLAADRAALDELGRRYIAYLDDPFTGVLTGGWIEPLERWLAQWHDR